MSRLKDFIISRVRVKLLTVFLFSPAEMFYVRQLTREIGEEINAVRRELTHMVDVGMVKTENRGNRVYFWFNKHYQFYPELLSMIVKTSGLGAAIAKDQQKLGKVKFALVAGRFARVMPRKEGWIDLLLVGDIVLPQLSSIVKTHEDKSRGEINYSVMTEAEFIFRKNRRDPFIIELMMRSRIMLIGDEEEFAG